MNKAKLTGVFILRDTHGRPKFDDPFSVPEAILDALTPNDIEYLEQLKRNTDGSNTHGDS